MSPTKLPHLSWGWGRVSGSVYSSSVDGTRASDDSSSIANGSGGGAGDAAPEVTIGVGFAGPVLARGWGHRLELLQAQPPRGYLTETVIGPPRRYGAPSIASSRRTSLDGGQGGGGGGSGGPLAGRQAAFAKLVRFVVSDECETSEPISAITWLTDQVRRRLHESPSLAVFIATRCPRCWCTTRRKQTLWLATRPQWKKWIVCQPQI